MSSTKKRRTVQTLAVFPLVSAISSQEWSAPIIRSIISPTHAQTSPPDSGPDSVVVPPSTDYPDIIISYEVTGDDFVAIPDPDAPDCISYDDPTCFASETWELFIYFIDADGVAGSVSYYSFPGTDTHFTPCGGTVEGMGGLFSTPGITVTGITVICQPPL